MSAKIRKRKKRNPVEKLWFFMRSWETKGWLEKTPAFLHDYKKHHPEFSILEENYEVIKDECTALIRLKDDIADMDGLIGGKKKSSIHRRA